MLISGDMQSYAIADWEDPIKCAKAEEEITSILTYAESICPNVFYIPGNHDPPDLFNNNDIRVPSLIKKGPDDSNEEKQLKENCTNVHGKIVNIAKGLKLVGYGGSKDNLVKKDGEVIDTIWEAYPYKDEEDYSVGLKSLFSKLSHEYSLTKDFQVIVMTHIGPHNSPSAIDKTHLDEDGHIYSGSKALEYILEQHKNFIVCNVHGHNHDSEKF